MRIAIIDDERPSRSELRALVLENIPNAEIEEGASAQDALALATSEEGFDAIFLDIHLGDMDGIALCPALQKLLPGVPIIFATAYEEYAARAFDMDATDYVMKPFDPKRIAKSLAKITARMQAERPEPKAEPSAMPLAGKISVACDKRTLLLKIDRIAYIETDSRQCILHTTKGDYTSNQPLGLFEKKLSAYNFFRIHKSYLVNLEYLEEIYPWFQGVFCVRLRGYEKENLPISRKQLRPLRERFE